MKKITKIAAIALSLITVAGIFSGCAKKAASTPKNRLEAILQRGYIEVATEPYFAPNEFIDPTKTGDDKYVGSDIELAKYIANKLGVKLKIVPLEFSAVLSSITEGKYDLAISGLAYKPDRAQAMNLSKGYYFDKVGHGLVIRKADAEKINGVADLADKVIVAQSASLQESMVKEQVPKYKQFKPISTVNDGFLMVQEKKADAIATYITPAELYIKNNPNCGLMVVEGFRFYVDPATSGTRVGIPKDETELTNKINEIIDEVTAKGLYDQWYTQYAEYAKQLGIQ